MFKDLLLRKVSKKFINFLLSVVIVTFDLSDIETLRHARKWKDDACESAIDPFVFLVGTKKDIVVFILCII